MNDDRWDGIGERGGTGELFYFPIALVPTQMIMKLSIAFRDMMSSDQCVRANFRLHSRS